MSSLRFGEYPEQALTKSQDKALFGTFTTGITQTTRKYLGRDHLQPATTAVEAEL